MKLLLIITSLIGVHAFAQSFGVNPNTVNVNGYTRSNGTYVQPYQRTAPDSNRYNNYSTYGNTNPYTQQQGTVHPRGNGIYGQ